MIHSSFFCSNTDYLDDWYDQTDSLFFKVYYFCTCHDVLKRRAMPYAEQRKLDWTLVVLVIELSNQLVSDLASACWILLPIVL